MFSFCQEYREEAEEREGNVGKDGKDENEALSVEGGLNTKTSRGKQKNNFVAKKPNLNIIQYLQQVSYGLFFILIKRTFNLYQLKSFYRFIKLILSYYFIILLKNVLRFNTLV